LGAFYRRLSARIGKQKQLQRQLERSPGPFYNAVRHGMTMQIPARPITKSAIASVSHNLQRRAKALGYVLQPTEIKVVSMAVS